MHDRIIIENRSDLLNDIECLYLVQLVIENGRLSNDGKQYCYYTSFGVDGKIVGVTADRNKRSDRFVVVDG